MTEWEKLGPSLDKLMDEVINEDEKDKERRQANVELAKGMIPFLKAGLSRVPAVGALYGRSIEFCWIKDYWYVIMSVDVHRKDKEIEIFASLYLEDTHCHCLPYSKDQEQVIVRILSRHLERLYSN